MDWYFIQKWWFLKLKRPNNVFVSYKHNFSLYKTAGLDYLWIIVMFLSAV